MSIEHWALVKQGVWHDGEEIFLPISPPPHLPTSPPPHLLTRQIIFIGNLFANHTLSMDGLC
ncbi:hypothetical protein NIES25_13600 [Nostoc linckia NIES-25]|nr:hypothetical protein NIES25_13600 [Nostoc linckia NIES-25]